MKLASLVTAMSLVSTPALSATWQAYGFGYSKCVEWEGHEQLGKDWLTGFVSGTNWSISMQLKTTEVIDMTKSFDIDILVQMMTNYCQRFPGNTIAYGATELINAFTVKDHQDPAVWKKWR